MPTHIQSVWADAWCYKGLATSARLLRRIGHDRSEEITAECEDYQATFVRALEAAAKPGPEWRDCEGNAHGLVPMAVHGSQDFEVRNAFYLDTGPLVLVFAGLLDASDPMMASTLKWFREGPPSQSTDTTPTAGRFRAAPRDSELRTVLQLEFFHSHIETVTIWRG